MEIGKIDKKEDHLVDIRKVPLDSYLEVLKFLNAEDIFEVIQTSKWFFESFLNFYKNQNSILQMLFSSKESLEINHIRKRYFNDHWRTRLEERKKYTEEFEKMKQTTKARRGRRRWMNRGRKRGRIRTRLLLTKNEIKETEVPNNENYSCLKFSNVLSKFNNVINLSKLSTEELRCIKKYSNSIKNFSTIFFSKFGKLNSLIFKELKKIFRRK